MKFEGIYNSFADFMLKHGVSQTKIKYFCKFLISRGIYEEYLNNVYHQNFIARNKGYLRDPYYIAKPIPIEEIINFTLYWDNTFEGFDFWNDINEEYHEFWEILHHMKFKKERKYDKF